MRLISIALPALLALSFAPALGGCFAAAQPGEAHAMRDGFTYLGERYVHGHGREVREAITGLRGDGGFRTIMLVVENAPVEMDEVVVTFADGERWEPKTRLVFGPDSTTRQIDLPGNVRRLKRVDFYMHNLPGDGQAKVELWGR